MGWSTTTGQSTRSWRLRTTRTPARLHSIVAWRLRFVATDSNSHPFFFFNPSSTVTIIASWLVLIEKQV
jgi:hypothetical protein